jgi:predicted nuclease of predicted toxin-antitoxin system
MLPGVLKRLMSRLLLHENPYMNLSPAWVQEFNIHQIEAVHWSSVGKFDAPDVVLMDWARGNDYIVFTHDLDFGTALALTKADKPSVIQVRTQNVTIEHLSNMLISTITTYKELLNRGALLVLDEDKKRIRILPL